MPGMFKEQHGGHGGKSEGTGGRKSVLRPDHAGLCRTGHQLWSLLQVRLRASEF